LHEKMVTSIIPKHTFIIKLFMFFITALLD